MTVLSPLRLYEHRLSRMLAQQLVQDRSSEPKARLNDCNTPFLADVDDDFFAFADDLLEVDPTILPSQMRESLRWAVLQAFYCYDRWGSIELDVSIHGTKWFIELSQRLTTYLEFAHQADMLLDPVGIHC